MIRVMFLLTSLFFFLSSNCHGLDIHYDDCQTLDDIIAKETREINRIPKTNYDDLAQLYVARGESYLMHKEYEKALGDFQNAFSYIGKADNPETFMLVAFRATMGEAIGYDNLGMPEQCQQSIQNLQAIVKHIGCENCIEDKPCSDLFKNSSSIYNYRSLTKHCKNNNQQNNDYSDILGPDKPPEDGWCEEVVSGVGRAMETIAALAPNYAVRAALIGTIELLLQRGLRCCRTGNFWKACVAPITRKWRDWKNHTQQDILPDYHTVGMFTI